MHFFRQFAWRWLSAPVFPKPENTRAAWVLNLVLVTTLCLGVINAVLIALLAPNRVAGFIPHLATIGMLALMLVLLHRGYVRAASWGLCLLVTLMGALMVVSEGVTGLSASVLILAIVLTGLLLGGQSAGLIAAAAIVITVLGSEFGPGAASTRGAWITLSVVYIITAFVLYLGDRSMREAFTRARLIEGALRESQSRFFNVAENTGAALWLWDWHTGQYLYLSPGFERIWGRPPEFLLEDANRFWDTIHPEDRQRLPGNRHDYPELWGDEHEEEFRILRPNGEVRWVRSRHFVVRDAEGKPFRVSGLNEDITPHKQAELALRVSEDRFRQLADNIPEAFWLYDDIAERYLYISPAYEHIWGRPVAELMADADRFWDTMLPDDVPGYRAFLEGWQTRDRDEAVYRILHPSGELRWIRSRVFRITPADSDRPLMAGLCEDITHQRQADHDRVERERLLAALEKEQELSEIKSRLMMTISHEFRTPLAVIHTSIDMLQRYAERMTPDQRAERMDIARAQIRHLTAMLNDIGLVVHGDDRLTTLKLEWVDLAQMCAATVAEIRDAAGEPHQLTFESFAAVPPILVDAELLRRVLTNLLGNAVKYSGGAAQVRCELSLSDRAIHIRVTDRGIGIPDEAKAHIFEPFFRADNTQAVGGTGLGLTIVRDSVERLGGTIDFESAVGQGTTFVVSLPQYQIDTVGSVGLSNGAGC